MTHNILVTGAGGFIGKHLVARLRQIGYTTYTLYDDLDITMCELIYEEVDHVFHLAAKTFVPLSWTETFDFYNVNIMGTVKVLEFCRKNKCSLTFISSYVYGTPETMPINESHPLKPNSPYNHSKLLAEELCHFYASQFQLQITILRPFNIYGPHQDEPFLVPALINQLLDKDTLTMEVMDLEPRRDFLYVDDLIEAMILTIENDKFGVYNVASGYSISVEEMIKTLLNVSGINKNYRSKSIHRVGEIMDIVADITKIKHELKWEPRVPLAIGLDKTIASIKKERQ